MFVNHVGSLVGALRNQAPVTVNCGVNYPKTLLHKLTLLVEGIDCFGGGSSITILIAMSLNQYSNILMFPCVKRETLGRE